MKSRKYGCRQIAGGILAVAVPLFLFGQSAAAQEEIVIGATIAQSGRLMGIVRPFPKLGEAWAKSINARGGIKLSKLGKSLPVRFVLYDDQSKPPTALKFYERLATVDKVHVFMGPFSSFVTNAALQATATHKIPFFMVESNDSVMFDKPNAWRTAGLGPAAWEHRRIVDLYKAKGGVKSFALVSRDNLHENQALQGFADAVKKAGMKVVYQNNIPKDTKDFSSTILAIKGAKADAVFVENIAPPWTIAFLKQAREQGLNPREFIVGHMPIPVIKAMGGWSENVVSSSYVFDGDTADHKELEALCKAAGFQCWQYPEAGIRYNTYKRLADSLERAGSLDREAIRKAMWATNLPLFGGEVVVKHDQRGYGSLYAWPIQIRGGKPVSLWPLSAGTGKHRPKNP
ncbi:MAG TPA: ABC transporter substrate-binding protein [Alphaproteobacteria bacterium]|jgi:branched-chain amino acid transport system substrate-binding protein|nr:ABC transporter substrate-binding protein [Alphaproteobacteria bacterium]MDP6271726.1 ABC transporter substrate-binding protein [Alphaproteobacteria bacterium]MDP7429343.1 ABC transporter substrate-binding protein [Alphaproteobacteria bacterium]HJM49706.1 ABC transporter substrate-binding protein [Alphaproteobacteria bacterium]